MNSDDELILELLADGDWYAGAALAHVLKRPVRAVASTLKRMVADGRLERSEQEPHQVRLARTEPEVEAVAASSFAIWDDGSMSVTRGQESMFLTQDDVRRLRSHLARYFEGQLAVSAGPVAALRIEG